MNSKPSSRQFGVEYTRPATSQNLMDYVVDGMVIAALGSALFSIFRFDIVIYPKWLQENCAARFYYGCFQVVVSMIVLLLGG